MHLVRVFTLLGTLAVLSGCATLSYPLPKCDGYAKRPLNRSMWEWENKTSSTGQQSSLSHETPRASALAASPVQIAFADFDEARSHRACQAG